MQWSDGKVKHTLHPGQLRKNQKTHYLQLKLVSHSQIISFATSKEVRKQCRGLLTPWHHDWLDFTNDSKVGYEPLLLQLRTDIITTWL